MYGFGFGVPGFSLCQHAVTIIDLVSTCLFFSFFFFILFIFSACTQIDLVTTCLGFSVCQHAGIITGLVSKCLVFHCVSMQA